MYEDEDTQKPKPSYDGKALADEGTKWMERIRAAEKREDDWRKSAMAAEKAYTNDDKGDEGKLYDFNILHSNVETIVPAIYNSTPVPDVRPRWTEAIGEAPKPPQMPQPQEGQPPPQPDPMVLAQFQQAVAIYQQQMQRDKDAKDFGDMIERVITTMIDDNKLDTEIEGSAQDAFLSGRGIVRVRFNAEFGEEGEEAAPPKNERVDTEAVSWRDFRMGPAKRWDKVPWVAFRHAASRETLEAKVVDPEIAKSYVGLDPVAMPENDDDDVTYWEVWCKESRKVKFIREHDSRIIKVEDDPLGLSGFFPMAHPVQPITLTGKMTPVCPFTIYRKLADELDNITKRIAKIMEGLKVRGIIAGQAEKLVALSEADDNEIRVETDLEGLAQTGGLEKAIMWWPIEQAIKVLKELYAQREIVKTSIYEITGISDIVRGASNANETLGAQEIKTRWGALRIQKMQRLIERQVRDIFGIMAELIVSKFSEPTLYQMTGIEITDGMRGLMAQPVLASYRVDVESDSTVRADLTRQKQDMSEFLAGTGNYFATMGPLMEMAPEAAEPITDLYAAMSSVFNLGRGAEEALERLKQIAKSAGNQPRPNPEADAAKMEAEAKAADRQVDMKMKQAEFQMKDQAEQRKEQRADAADKRKMAFEQQMARLNLQVAQVGLEIKKVELALKEREAELSLQTKQAESQIKIDTQQQSAAIKAQNAAKPAEA